MKNELREKSQNKFVWLGFLIALLKPDVRLHYSGAKNCK